VSDLQAIVGANEPFVICTYGPSGAGKSTDMGYSFPTALFVAAPGALSSISSVCGYTPDRAEVPTIAEGTSLIEHTAKGKKYDTIVFDDFSFLAEQTLNHYEKKKLTGFKLWDALRDDALTFREKSRYCGINVVLNAWEQVPKTKPDGSRVRGGPQLSGKLPEQIPAMCDVVLRACYEQSRKPWPWVYRCNSDPSYVMKDRFKTAAQVDPGPMNLSEILRASGRHIARHPKLPNQEAEVAAIAGVLTGVPSADLALANQIYGGLVSKGYPPEVATWTLRDAVDRAVIREAKRAAVMYFFAPAGPGQLL
jgi:hypothetical protein